MILLSDNASLQLSVHCWAYVQDPCAVVLASAGCTFALFVPFIADTGFNFDAIRQGFPSTCDHSCTTRGSVKLQGLRSLLKLPSSTEFRRVERFPG